MDQALLVYLTNQKKKQTRKDVESKRDIKELKKQPAEVVV
jgi:hypothetical protein